MNRDDSSEFLRNLEARQIRLWEADGQLRFSAPKGALTPELRAMITGQKIELIEFLRKNRTAEAPQPTTTGIPNTFQSTENAVAVIGLAGRFPGADNIQQLWQNLRTGRESIKFFPDDELLADGIDPSLLRNPAYVKAKGYLEGADTFDAHFFGYSPREAELIDPQQRLFLETAWQALEHAGYDPGRFPGRIGVYGGVSPSEYLLALLAMPELVSVTNSMQLFVSNERDYPATRVSYELNLRGPSIPVQTACSTSLVAIHLACRSLLGGECEMALAGGASVYAPRKSGYLYEEGSIVSPDGHCRAFDSRAQGTVGGEGVGFVVLKTLAKALADGDTIHAVVIGSAVNNDGSTKIGFTAPSVQGQSEAIVAALQFAGISADDISYMEAHGTGTLLGDPIEIAALTQAFRETSGKVAYCALGSIKPNIGHLDATAGVAGFIKTVLALEHREIPPSINFEQPNPKIDFETSPFFVNTRLAPWVSVEGLPRRAGVSGFGVGGTNAHIILEEAPPLPPADAARDLQLLVISGKTESAVQATSENLADYLEKNPSLSLADAAFTLQVGRGEFIHRRFLVAAEAAEAVPKLRSTETKQCFKGKTSQREPAVIFVFPGQGAQFVDMGRELYQREEVYRGEVDVCARILQKHLGLDIRQVLYPEAGDRARSAQQINETWVTQPAIFVVEYALARLWMSWGIKPSALIGHSIGEYVAAVLAETFTLEDALGLLAARARLMQGLPAGSMLGVRLNARDVEPILPSQASIAAINSPTLCTVSGPTEVLHSFHKELEGRKIAARFLATSHAFHSAMMDPILAEFTDLVLRTPRQPPRLKWISTCTGNWITAEDVADAGYWSKQLRRTVRFTDALTVALATPESVLLEVGPGQTLSQMAGQHPAKGMGHSVFSTLGASSEAKDLSAILTTLGRLWLAGIKPDWSAFQKPYKRRRIPLPVYPFERKRYWIRPKAATAIRQATSSVKKSDLTGWLHLPTWKTAPLLRHEHENPTQKKSCLVFSPSIDWNKSLIERLAGDGHHVIQVQSGRQFRRMGPDQFQIDPGQPGDYESLVTALGADHLVPDWVFHLWALDPFTDPGFLPSKAESSMDRGFFSLLHLTQALGRLGVTSKIKIKVVVAGTAGITGEEELNPLASAVLGPCIVIPQEHDNMSCSCIDVVPSTLTTRGPRVLDQLIGEFESSRQDTFVAYRGQQRWIRSFDPVPPGPPGPFPMPLRPRGVCLITGGLGGIGLELADYLARSVQARLILVGRSPFPPREQWTRWMTEHPSNNSTSLRIARLLKIESLGSEIMVVDGDVANPSRMQEVIELAETRFGAVNGIIHAAGLAGGGVIQLKSRETAQRVLSPKIAGTIVLGEAFRDRSLDFFVLCSSLAAVFGGFGQVDYCAANAFQDAYAHAYRAWTGTPTLSINWDAWQDVGMAVATEIPEHLRAQRAEELKLGIAPAEGQDVFARILSMGTGQVLVSPRDLAVHLAVGRQDTTPEVVKTRQEKYARPDLDVAFVAPKSETEKRVASIWQDLLGLEGLGSSDNFFDLGGDSLLAVQVIWRVREAFKISLQMGALFQAPTAAEFAHHIDNVRWAGQIDESVPPAPAGIRQEGSV